MDFFIRNMRPLSTTGSGFSGGLVHFITGYAYIGAYYTVRLS